MDHEIIEKKIKKGSSFFRLSDNSWCEIATKWGKGSKTGLIVCRGKDAAIPILADLLIDEAKRRKYKNIDVYPKGLIENEIHGKEKYNYTKKVLDKIKGV